MAKTQTEPRIAVPGWCTSCSTQHTLQERCPGQLLPAEPERHGWRVNADTDRGIEAYGVLLARCEDGWRARILTYPNILWLVPGGTETIKFAASTPDEAEHKAAEYIKAHCRARGFEMRADRSTVRFLGVDPEGATSFGKDRRPAPRKIRFLPLRFGVGGATEPGGTGNLSETGLFVITDSPVPSGKRVALALRLADARILKMSGDVIWMNKDHHAGRAPGMGVRLDSPPDEYRDYVKRLP